MWLIIIVFCLVYGDLRRRATDQKRHLQIQAEVFVLRPDGRAQAHQDVFLERVVLPWVSFESSGTLRRLVVVRSRGVR